MPSLESVLKFREEMYRESVDLIAKKGHDYNRQQQHNGDTLFNLKVAAVLGIVDTPERGILVRLSDKFMRLISLMTADVDPAVKGESVRDTVRDLHNYSDYCLQMYEERWAARARRVMQTPVPNPVPVRYDAAQNVCGAVDDRTGFVCTREAGHMAYHAAHLPSGDVIAFRRDPASVPAPAVPVPQPVETCAKMCRDAIAEQPAPAPR